MKQNITDVTADAVALQERDAFRAQGWLKIVSPAKVNLNLAIGNLRDDGYHEAETVMHALNLHDVVYVRHIVPDEWNGLSTREASCTVPLVRMVSCGDVTAPDLPSEKNIASKAVLKLAELTQREDAGIEIRIEKNIPAQGGLGGGSSNAAAALLGAARLWGMDPADPAIEQAARALGSDVAFFLHGGCSFYEGTGELFVRDLEPDKRAIALVKPAGGVSTAEAYRTFDDDPVPIPAQVSAAMRTAERACDLELFNNLASAAERIMPELARVRQWLGEMPDVESALLCGSGATTFAIMSDFASACRVVSEARKLGYWARATSFGSLRAMIVSS